MSFVLLHIYTYIYITYYIPIIYGSIGTDRNVFQIVLGAVLKEDPQIKVGGGRTCNIKTRIGHSITNCINFKMQIGVGEESHIIM